MKQSGIIVEQGQLSADPSSPASGYSVLYPKTDGDWYIKGPGGVVGKVMTNPMTTANDVIIGGASGIPTRLAVGSDGQILTVVSGSVAWADPSGSSGIPAGGSAGQILGKVTGTDYDVAWIPYPTLELIPGDGILIDGENNISIDEDYITSLVPPTSLTTIGSTPNANGASISAGILNLQPANYSYGGVLTKNNFVSHDNRAPYIPAEIIRHRMTSGLPDQLDDPVDVSDASAYNAYPTILKDRRGRLHVYYLSGSSHVASDHVLKHAVSGNGGESWTTNTITVAQDHVNEVHAKLLSNGKIGLMISCDTGLDDYNCYYYESDNDGESISLIATVQTGFSSGSLSGPLVTSFLEDRGVLYALMYGRLGSDIRSSTVLIKSTDWGRTWGSSVAVATAPSSVDYNESKIVRYKDKLVVFVRNETSSSLMRTESSDGVTWGTLATVTPPNYTVSEPDVMVIGDMVHMHYRTYAGGPGGLARATSFDGGLTWDSWEKVENVPDGTGAMQYATTIYENGLLVTAYGMDEDTGLLYAKVRVRTYSVGFAVGLGGNSSSGGGGGSSQWDDVTGGINTDNGKVGIGNATPTYFVDILKDQNSGTIVGVANMNSGSGAYTVFRTTTDAGVFEFGMNSTAGGNNASIYADKPITIYASASGTAAFRIASISAIHYLNMGDGTGSSDYGIRNNGGTVEVKHYGGSWAAIGGGGGGSSQWDDVTGGINYAGGKLGVGNSSPTTFVDILKSQNSGTVLQVSNPNTGSGAYTLFRATTDAGTLEFGMNSAAGGGNSSMYSDGAISIYSNGSGTEAFRIASVSSIYYLNMGGSSGSSDYGFRNNGGTIEFKNSGGSWAALGSGGGSGQWTDTTGGIYYEDLVTIGGTSAPNYALDVVGSGVSAGSINTSGEGAFYGYGYFGNSVLLGLSSADNSVIGAAGNGKDIVFVGWNGTLNAETARIISGGSFRINNTYTLPSTGGSDGQVLTWPASGSVLAWETPSGGGGGGETNTASNLGGGLANYASKSGVDLRFNSFSSTDFDLASNLISVDASIARLAGPVFTNSITTPRIISYGTAPTAVDGPNLNATVTVTGNDIAGRITVTLISSTSYPTQEEFATVTFNNPYAATPHIVFSPGNSAAADMTGMYLKNPSTTGFSIARSSSAGSIAVTTYIWDYMVVE